MASLTQSNRQLTVESPLGKDQLILTAFQGSEEISQLFRYELQLMSPDEAIAPARLVGQPIGFGVQQSDGSTRQFHGVVSRLARGSRESGMRNYQLTVVPWLWLLTRRSDVRIFQDLTVPEIVEQVFQQAGFSDFDLAGIHGSHPKWDYCVQYRESDYQFVARLLEQEGIFYFFRHQQGKHTLMLADQKGAHAFLPQREVSYDPARDGAPSKDAVIEWRHEFQFVSGKFSQQDYNFETPKDSLMTESSTVVSLKDVTNFEVYDYPGEYQVKPDGDEWTRQQMEAEEAGFDVAAGESTCKSFSVGGKFTIKQHDDEAEEGQSYVITSIRHQASEPTVDGQPKSFDYRNAFTCIPDSVTYRPPQTARKPIVQGPQTAVVVGPQGEEIYTDRYGRIKVQFHWDRLGRRDENSSCWIRCVQSSAGRNWGAMFIPRIGQEVVVTFLEGDPDRPLVTGVVYNADQMPAYSLPDEKTKSYIKTNSSPGGDGYNEIRFEDLAGQEQVFMHAQRNLDLRVLNDSMERIVHDRHLIVGNEDKREGDQRELVYRDKHLNIKRHHVEHIEGSMQLTIGKGDGEDPGNLDLVVEKDKKELVEGDSHLHICGEHQVQVDKKVSLTYRDGMDASLGGSFALETSAGQNVHIKGGGTVVIEGGMQLSLKVGGSFIDISPTGVAISGPTVLINSGGAAGSFQAPQPAEPQDANVAHPELAKMADDSKTGKKSC